MNMLEEIFESIKVEREVCKDVRGCEFLKGGNCPDCVMDFVWE